jgi:hypothetical protein
MRVEGPQAPAALPRGKDMVPILQEAGWAPRAGLDVCGKCRTPPNNNKIAKIQLFTIKVLTQQPRGILKNSARTQEKISQYLTKNINKQ